MKYRCVPLLSDVNHQSEIKNFVIDREKKFSQYTDKVIGLEAYLKECAWEDDVRGDVKIYLIKDTELDCIAAYFGLKAGMVIDNTDTQNYSSQEKLEILQEKQEILLDANIKTVSAIVPGIEISHFAVNDNYRRKLGNDIRGLGRYFYPTFIYPIIEEIASKIGVRIIYLFAAGDEHLIQYYKKVFNFEISTLNDFYTPLQPSYDDGCKFMYQILSR